MAAFLTIPCFVVSHRVLIVTPLAVGANLTVTIATIVDFVWQMYKINQHVDYEWS